MEKYVDGKLIVENARVIFKNFSGAETKFNRAGNRNFCMILNDRELADILERDGWNIKMLAPRDDDEEPRFYTQVSVSYKVAPPKIVLVTRRARTLLNEDTIDSLDYADISNIDMIVRPYEWEVNGKTGIKGYLQTMYVTLNEDEFAEKYAKEEYPEE